MPPTGAEETILVHAARPRDVRLASEFLRQAGFQVQAPGSVDGMLRAMAAEPVGAILLTEECVSDVEFVALQRLLQRQPPWSDLPVILFVSSKHSTIERRLAELGGNVTTIERPVMTATLVTALRSALRSRRKQYELRDLLEGHQRALERLREQDRRKNEFLAMLGHELRNPLGAMHNALQILGITASPEVRGRAHEVLDRQSRHLARLVDDLLDVSRVTLGRIHLVREPVDLQEIAARCVHYHQAAARRGGRELRFEGRGGPLVVHGDGVRLEQVLTNLVTNALKYTPAGGTIVVSTDRDGPRGVVRVTDDGAGIEPEVLPRIFELFAQGAEPLDRHRGGLGLGLSLAKSLIDRHGGTIEAASEGQGRGSTFVVRVPLAADAAPAAPVAANSGRKALGRRVAVIEDNDDARETLRMILELQGADVVTARDGIEGLELLLAAGPDLAIVDIGLPRLDGYELARRVRTTLPRGQLTLIALTGYGQPEDCRRALDAGFDVHLTKPVRDVDLVPWLRAPGENATRH